MTERLFRATAPVFKIDGQVKGELARDILRLEVDETTLGMKRLSACFVARGPRESEAAEQLLYLDGQLFDFGKRLEVSIGDGDEARTIFKGAISAIEAGFNEGEEPSVTIFAEDKLMELRTTRRCKTYLEKTDADIAEDLARAHGLTPDVAADGPSYDVVQQINQSDLAFLRERARLVDAEIWIDGDKLCFKSRAHRAGTKLDLTRGGGLMDVVLRADLAHQRTSVKVSGYDASARETVDEEATADDVRAEAGQGLTGPATMERAFGARVSLRVRQAPLVGGEARAFAKGEMLRRARRFVTVVGTTDGSPDMVVGSQVTLTGVGRPFEGEPYYVTTVLHSYDLENGHRTRFEAERPTVSQGS